MASSKDTFESATFGAMSFACGTFRGIGTGIASAVASWQYAILSGNKGHVALNGNIPHVVLSGNKGHVITNEQP